MNERLRGIHRATCSTRAAQIRGSRRDDTPPTSPGTIAGSISSQRYVGTSVPHEFMNIVQQLQEDNRRLQLTVTDMRRQLDRGPYSTGLHPVQAASVSSISPNDTWLSSHPPTQTSLHQGQPTLHAAQGCTEEPEEWPIPPPPVHLPCDNPDPPHVKFAPPPQPPAIAQELSQRLQELHVQRTAAAVTTNTDTQNRVSQLAPISQTFSTSVVGNILSPQQVSTPTLPLTTREKTYRGPTPSIPEFTRADPRQFACLRLALDNILPADATERFKYQVLRDHLHFEEALLVADSYSNSVRPYTDTMASLIKHFGQPHHLSLQRIAELMDEPNIRSNDITTRSRWLHRATVRVSCGETLQETSSRTTSCLPPLPLSTE
ncbi:uncharacterized protein [Eucyclogobius newberryi]|uniref:uncharacterized protein n=1 Tax=Eucyclogobius newberryi TaxID=166745 RepID=UPI003B5B39E7